MQEVIDNEILTHVKNRSRYRFIEFLVCKNVSGIVRAVLIHHEPVHRQIFLVQINLHPRNVISDGLTLRCYRNPVISCRFLDQCLESGAHRIQIPYHARSYECTHLVHHRVSLGTEHRSLPIGDGLYLVAGNGDAIFRRSPVIQTNLVFFLPIEFPLGLDRGAEHAQKFFLHE